MGYQDVYITKSTNNSLVVVESQNVSPDGALSIILVADPLGIMNTVVFVLTVLQIYIRIAPEH